MPELDGAPIEQVVPDVGAAGLHSGVGHGAVRGVAREGQRRLRDAHFGLPGPTGQTLDLALTEIAARWIHLRVRSCWILAEHPLDHAECLDDVAPLRVAQGTQACEQQRYPFSIPGAGCCQPLEQL